eukprot:864522_1
MSLKAIKSGKMYMVTVDGHFLLPIHPEPNADHKISTSVRPFEVIVITDEASDDGLYLQTVLPISGWIRKDCIDNGTLVPVTKETFSQFINQSKTQSTSRCGQCLHNSRCLSHISTSIRKHPVYVMALYLLLQFLAEVALFANILTNIAVAIALSSAKENWLFMLTCVFMLTPYYIAWAASFGYLQQRTMESTTTYEQWQELQDDGTAVVKTKTSNNHVQICVLLFAIAPIGVCVLVFIDVYLLLEDFIIKPIFLCYAKRIFRGDSQAEKGYKKLRRLSEVVSGTICQTVLQICIVTAFRDGRVSADVEIKWVVLSLVTSCIVLGLWTIVLCIEANQFGLPFYEYVTVVLQGSFNFVPYLPAIEQGEKQRVNWTDFTFDSHSVGLVAKALISPECSLVEIKLSAWSLSKLTRQECKFLGQMLAHSPENAVNVVISRSWMEMEALFNTFDTDNSRSFDFIELLQLCTALRQDDDGVVSAKDVAEIFLMLADPIKHEVYLTDLLWKINKSTDKLPVVDYDSPVMYALKSRDEKLLTFMIAAKVCDDVTWEYYTTTLVTNNRHEDALMMAEEKGIPIVVELISGHNLPAHDFDEDNVGTSDPYCSVSVADKVKRTETIHKNLNPMWRQPLLFILPVEDIPALSDSLGGLQPMARNKTDPYTSSQQIVRRRTNVGGGHRRGRHHHQHGDAQQKGVVGSTSSRLEINFKIYDYDETDDDFFMGSYKHKIQWSTEDLKRHQDGATVPLKFERELNTNRDKAKDQKVGSFKFRIYTGTLQYYIKWGKNKSAQK